jgi:general secretion pathway protein G
LQLEVTENAMNHDARNHKGTKNTKKAGASGARAFAAALGITIRLPVVVAVVALCAVLVAPGVSFHPGTKQTVAKLQIGYFSTALGAYKHNVGRYPTTDEGLGALRVKPQGAERWDGPYLAKDIPTDPWGRAYIYKYPGDHGAEPDIISYGADGKAGGDKDDADIYSWKRNQ